MATSSLRSDTIPAKQTVSVLAELQPTMSQSPTTAEAIQDLFNDSRFAATWAMLTSPSAGERASALEAVTRQLNKRGLDMRDILTTAISAQPQIVEKVVERVRVETAHTPDAATVDGFVDVIEELDAIDQRDGQRKVMLSIKISTASFTIAPVIVREPHLVGRVRNQNGSDKPFRLSLQWDREFRTNRCPTCVLTGMFNRPDN